MPSHGKRSPPFSSSLLSVLWLSAAAARLAAAFGILIATEGGMLPDATRLASAAAS